MKAVDPGHDYIIDVYDETDDNRGLTPDRVVFLKRIGKGYPGNEGNPYPGTNCQEVLRVLIDRVKYLDNQIPHTANFHIIECLRDALWLFEERAAERHGRKLENLTVDIENERHCNQCGHIQCEHMK